MLVLNESKTKKKTSTDFYCSIIGRFPEGGWAYMGFKHPKCKVMHQEFFRNNALETRTKSRLDKLIGLGTNAYICPQVFSHGARSAENLYALQNMVIDIDMHSERYCRSLRDQRINSLAHLLLHDADDYGLPEPNWIIYTGRGLQIWWRHESMAANRCLNTWTSIMRCFIEIIKQIITDHLEGDPEDALAGLSIDEQASLNPVGFFRIPGTYNSSARTYATIADGVEPGHIYSYKELIQFRNGYRAGCPTATPMPPRKTRYKSPGNMGHISAWAESTALKIEYLRALRDSDLGEETRNNFCLALYSLYRAAGMDESAAMGRLYTFNEGFKQPMLDKELKSTLYSARKKLYQYSTHGLINLLDISEEEASAIGLKCGGEKPESNKKQKLYERNRQIIHLYTTTNMTQEEVGDVVGASRKTVGDVLRSAGINRADYKAEKIRSLNESGKSVEQITQEIGCSGRTVYRVIQNTSGKNTAGAPKAAQTNTHSIPEEVSKDLESKSTESTISVETISSPCDPVHVDESREGEPMDYLCDNQTQSNICDAMEGPTFRLSASDKMYLPGLNYGYHTLAAVRRGSSGPLLGECWGGG